MAPGVTTLPSEDHDGTKVSASKTLASAGQKQDYNFDSGMQCIATGGYSLPTVPQFTDLYAKRQWQLDHMAGAFRIFARKGFSEGHSGHISVRDPVDPNTFWINPLGKHYGMLKASDMVQIDEEGQVVGGNKTAVNAAGFMIHSAIHKARPDVNAACHTHSKYGKAWATFARPLEILNQDAATFWNDQAVYDDYGGVALGKEEGVRIAKSLGPTARTVILRNHGLLTCGSTVDEAAYLFTLAERSCEIQLLVEASGLPKVSIEDEEAKFSHDVQAHPDMLYAEFQPDLEFEIWKSHGELSLGPAGSA